MGSFKSDKCQPFGGLRSRRVASFCAALLAASAWATLAVAAPIVANLQPKKGVPGSFQDPNPYTVQAINDAGGIIIGDKQFDLFDVTTTKSLNAIAPDAMTVALTPVMIGGDYGFKVNGPWSAPAGQLSDSTIEFRATILQDFASLGWMFKDNSLWMTAFGVSNNTNAGAVSVSENIYAQHPSLAKPPIANEFVYYAGAANQQLFDSAVFAPLTQIWVVKDVVAYGGTGTVGVVHLSEFYQTFSQVQAPEPGTFGMLLAGLLGFVGYIWRRRRRA